MLAVLQSSFAQCLQLIKQENSVSSFTLNQPEHLNIVSQILPCIKAVSEKAFDFRWW